MQGLAEKVNAELSRIQLEEDLESRSYSEEYAADSRSSPRGARGVEALSSQETVVSNDSSRFNADELARAMHRPSTRSPVKEKDERSGIMVTNKQSQLSLDDEFTLDAEF